ncbi:MAG: recombination regulator RecX [Pseudomonadota bacterium]|uniref:recombination regulator RecX n=1 Tax=Polaromonas sp. TaxID=1869339 RepID=UPI00178D7C82|nr:recombination regulator RecX [Polaromonas sp.]MBA3594684.1 recombination regulator RecX [Polaromonas sp.]MDQ3272511.1 recombination regulator RecX [Pseudomonadota bacterium]
MPTDKPAAVSGFGLSLKGRALRCLAQREHSRAELERKLAAHAESPEQLAQVLDDLQAKDFISEVRVVESVINRRAARFGASRIKYELLNKGLSADAVTTAVLQLKQSEDDRAREVWLRKFGVPAADAAGQARQMRFLLTRGFSNEVVRRTLRQARGPDARDDAMTVPADL